MVSVLSGSNISAVFTPDGKITGASGCSEYSATYSLHDATLGISQVKSTKIACEPDIMQQENQYLALLPGVNTYQMSGDQMVLYTALGQKILQFKKAETGTVTTTPKSTTSVSTRTLTGSWTLKSYTDSKGGSIPVLSGTPVTAKFLADGSLSGSAGCNQYTTTYSVSGTSISYQRGCYHENGLRTGCDGTRDCISCTPPEGREICDPRRFHDIIRLARDSPFEL